MWVVDEDQIIEGGQLDSRSSLDDRPDARVPELDRETEVATDGRQVRLKLARDLSAVDEELAPGAEP
jgi:hypothetical protein